MHDENFWIIIIIVSIFLLDQKLIYLLLKRLYYGPSLFYWPLELRIFLHRNPFPSGNWESSLLHPWKKSHPQIQPPRSRREESIALPGHQSRKNPLTISNGSLQATSACRLICMYQLIFSSGCKYLPPYYPSLICVQYQLTSVSPAGWSRNTSRLSISSTQTITSFSTLGSTLSYVSLFSLDKTWEQIADLPTCSEPNINILQIKRVLFLLARQGECIILS